MSGRRALIIGIVLLMWQETPPHARVASVEIGALAYFGDRRVVDLAGLLAPALRAARQEHRLAEVLAAEPPDYLVDNPAFHDNFLAQLVASSDLERHYRPIATFSRPEYPHAVRLLQREERVTRK